MKKLVYFFGALLLAVLVTMFSSCAKFSDDEVIPETPEAGNYQLKSANAVLTNDTLYVPINTIIIFTLEKLGVKVVADFNFANGTPVITGDIVSTKFATIGVYKITATDLSVTPNVVKTAIVKARKDVVIVPPASEAVIILSTSTLAGVNTTALGLRCDVVNAFNPTALVNGEVQYEMLPAVNWTHATLLASDITTVNNVKYYKWVVTAANNQKIRFTWLIGTSWAYAPNSIYRQVDGVYVMYIKDGVISKEVITASLPGSVGDAKVRATLENISGAQNLVLYFQKIAFNVGAPSLKYKIDTGAEQTVIMNDATGFTDYYVVKIPVTGGSEINFWPLSTVGTVDISGSTVWNVDKLCGRIQIQNLKSAIIGGDASLSIILG